MLRSDIKEQETEQEHVQTEGDHIRVVDRDDDDTTSYKLQSLVNPAKTAKDKVQVSRFTLGDIATGKQTKKLRKGDIFTYESNLTVDNAEPTETDSLNSAIEMKALPPVTAKSKYQDGLKILKTSGLLKDANERIRQAESSDLIYTIVTEFNAMIRTDKHAYVSAQGWWNKLFTDIERVEPNEVMLATRNGVPEIFGYQPEQLIKNTKIYNPTITIKKIDTYDLDKTNYFGAGRTHYLRVKPGHFGLGTLDGEAVLLNEGIHIIHGLFSYEGEVNQQNYHIQHGSIQIVRVPPAHLGLFRVGQTFMIVEANERPYVYLETDFKFYKCIPDSHKLVGCGTYQRATPEVNDVVIVSDNGGLGVLKQKPGEKHIFITDPLVRVLAFVSLNKKNKEFPYAKNGTLLPYVYKYRGNHIEVHLNIIYQVTDIQKFIEQGLDLSPSRDNVLNFVENAALTELGKKMDPAKNKNADLAVITTQVEIAVKGKLAEAGIDMHALTLRQAIAHNSHFRLVREAPTSHNQQTFFQQETSMRKLKQSKSVDSLATTASNASTNDTDVSAPSSTTTSALNNSI